MLLIAAALWGSCYTVQSIMSDKLGTFTILFTKVSFSFLYVILAYLNKQKFDKNSIKYGLLVGATTLCGLIFQQLGIASTTVSKASFISGLYVVIVPIIGLFTRKKPKRKFWIAVAIASVGMYLLCLGGELVLNLGDIAILISAVFFAFQIIFIDKYAKKVKLYPFVATQQILIMVVTGTIMLIKEKPTISDFDGLVLPALFIALLAGVACTIIQNKYQPNVDPTVASLIMSLESVFGTILGVVVLNQVLTARELLGCILMFIGIVVAQ